MKLEKITILFLISISSCTVSESISKNEIANESINGRWELLQSKSNGIPYSGSNNIYTFTDTSFKNINYWFTDNEGNNGDGCGDRSKINYSQGRYVIKDSVLYLDGVYTDETFIKENTNLCAHVGRYKIEVEILKISDTLILDFMIRSRFKMKQQVKFIKK